MFDQLGVLRRHALFCFFVLGEGTTQREINLAVIALYRGGRKRMLMAKKDCCNISLSFLALLDNESLLS